ncbi:Fic family protein [Plesiocystis pacifica SIR-1]|uniref:Fic family protein n=1 Tax=Plesiocystis pacifica SIR-1 TaxID=391625 RepID=A6FYF4_9BACT|nr:Fic family protein [Plesiocystis pacifica]EDM81226.1 Fic family protein [Plesiocystis pacifica SIR-1]
MAYSPRYQISETVLRAAEELSAARAVVELLPLPFAQVRALRREASIRVAHNSTWIENRTLALETAAAAIHDRTDNDRERSQPEIEVRNYFDALDLIDANLHVAPNEDWMRRLHACIMKGNRAGRPRERSEYRQATVQVGNFTYVPPAWEDVPKLMSELSQWAADAIDELPDYLFAAILAYQFVTIHPFMDGNGRTCRALATWALRRHYDSKGLLNVEEFYVRDLAGYYDSLQMGLHFSYYDSNERGSRSDPDLSQWLDYFCSRLGEAARHMRESIEGHFRARHPELLDDPLSDLPDNLRRFLVDLESLAEPFGSAGVSARFGVSRKTARAWLSRWQADGVIVPLNPEAARVHKFQLSQGWLERLDAAEPGE